MPSRQVTDMLLTMLSVLCLTVAALLPEWNVPMTASALAPHTGDINMMIIVAVILIAAFLIFILLKSGRKGR